MVLVTGGTGLLGTYFLLQLVRLNKKVRVLLRHKAPKHEVLEMFKIYEPEKYLQFYNSLLWVEGDLLDISSLEIALKGVTHVYHIAGKVSFDENQKDELYKVNVEGTKNIINISIEKQIEKFCFISSIATLDIIPGQPYIDEKAEWNFKNIHSSYASSKYAAEMEVWRGSQEGLKVIVVNPGIILGSGNWERSSGFLYDMAMTKNAFYPSGLSAYIDAEDVSKISIQLMDNNSIFNEKYILVSENATYQKVFQILRKYFNKKPAIKISDFWLSKIALFSRILPIKKKLNKATFLALTSKTGYCNKKINETLGFTFTPLKKSLEFHANNYLHYKKIKND